MSIPKCTICSRLLTSEFYSGEGDKCNNCVQWFESIKIKPKNRTKGRGGYNENDMNTLLSRIVKNENDCWIYSPVNQDGYGRMWYENKCHPAHRLSYMFHTKLPVPKDRVVCHKCDNRACVNPAHLFLGTQKENLEDMTRKGRDKRVGSKNGFSKLKESDIPFIFSLRKKGLTYKKIATFFPNIGKHTIGLILKRKIWTHVQIEDLENKIDYFKTKNKKTRY